MKALLTILALCLPLAACNMTPEQREALIISIQEHNAKVEAQRAAAQANKPLVCVSKTNLLGTVTTTCQ